MFCRSIGLVAKTFSGPILFFMVVTSGTISPLHAEEPQAAQAEEQPAHFRAFDGFFTSAATNDISFQPP